MENHLQDFDSIQNAINRTDSNQRGQFSDGYHSFNELYEFRKALTAALFNELYESTTANFNVHKSWKHHDGQPCYGGGWFIVTANLSPFPGYKNDQVSFHYEAKDWDLFKCTEKETGDKWDGHTPAQALQRLLDFSKH